MENSLMNLRPHIRLIDKSKATHYDTMMMITLRWCEWLWWCSIGCNDDDVEDCKDDDDGVLLMIMMAWYGVMMIIVVIIIIIIMLVLWMMMAWFVMMMMIMLMMNWYDANNGDSNDSDVNVDCTDMIMKTWKKIILVIIVIKVSDVSVTISKWAINSSTWWFSTEKRRKKKKGKSFGSSWKNLSLKEERN